MSNQALVNNQYAQYQQSFQQIFSRDCVQRPAIRAADMTREDLGIGNENLDEQVGMEP